MAVPNSYFESWWVGDGVATEFSYGYNGSIQSGFDAISPNYVKCHIILPDETVMIPEYIVNFDESTISIVSITSPDGDIFTAPPVGSQVRIFRDVPETQDLTSDTLKQSTYIQLARVLDRIVAMIQEVQSQATHNVPQMQEGFRDIVMQWLKEENNLQLYYWDNEQRKLVATDWTATDARKVIDEAVRSITHTVKTMEWFDDAVQMALNKPTGIEYVFSPFSSNIVQQRVRTLPSGVQIFEVMLNDGGWIGIGGVGQSIITEHNDLVDRDVDDCHPIEAITDLRPELDLLREDLEDGVMQLFHTSKPRLTGVMTDTMESDITEIPDGSGLAIPAMDIIINKKVYDAKNADDIVQVHINAQNVVLQDLGSGTHKAFYFYWSIDGLPIFNEVIPRGSVGADRVYLGSGFAVKVAGQWTIQAGSFKSAFWLPGTSVEIRQDPLNHISNIDWTPYNTLSMKLGSFTITGEGINYASDTKEPNTVIVPEKAPCSFKIAYPGYADIEVETTDFSKLNVWYNTDTGTLEPIPAGSYGISAPFITPSQQVLMIIQQGTTANPGYFADLPSALLGMPSLRYDFTNVSSRIVPMGMCWGIKSGITSVSDTAQLYTIQGIPAQLKQYGFDAGGGASPSITGLSVYDNAGNLIGSLGAIREIQAGEEITFSIAGGRLIVSTRPANKQNIASPIVLTADTAIAFDSGIEIQPIDATAGDIANATITMTFPSSTPTEALTYEVNIEVGSIKPNLTWDSSIRWLNDYDGVDQIDELNKTTKFIFSNEGGVIVGNKGGAY